MKTNTNNNWGFQSASFWMTLLIATGIIFIGLRFIIAPAIGADGFGIHISSPDDLAFGRIKGIRDIFSGLILLPFLILKMRRAAALSMAAATIIPAADFFIVLTTNGPNDLQPLLIHGLTVIYMIVTTILLFQNYADNANH